MKVALVTRAFTRNQGNIALSRAWRMILERHCTTAETVVIERVPDYLTRYTLAQFDAQADPLAHVDAIARHLVHIGGHGGGGHGGAGRAGDTIRLNLNPAPASRPGRFRQWLRPRSRLAHIGFFRSHFAARQALLTGCDVVVMNAAGEFRSDLTDTPLRYLLDLRAAQLAGCKTAFVNTSFEITDPRLLAIAVHVLDRCDLLLFRDDASLECYRRAGGQAVAEVVTDAALLHGELQPCADATGRVAIALSGGAQTADHRGLWLSIAQRVAAAGYQPVFVSNEWSTDGPIFTPWLEQYGFAAAGEGLDVDAYVVMLRDFDALITGRLHSGAMALIAGVPIIPVEIGTFKMSGLFNRLGIACHQAPAAASSADIDAMLAPLSGDKAAWLAAQRAQLEQERCTIELALSTHLRRLFE